MSEDELRRDAQRQGMVIALIVGLVLIGIGVVLFFLGSSFEEPRERLATRSVPAFAPIALSVAGALVAVTGVVVMFRGVRSRA